MAEQVTSKISPTQVGTGRNKRNLYTATKVSGPFGSPPKYITEILKYDNAKGENARTIGTRSSDDPGKIIWNENASGIDKQNATKLSKTSADQVKSIRDEVAENAQEKEALNKASGNNNKAAEGDDTTSDSTESSGELGDLDSIEGTREDDFGFYVFPETLRASSDGQDFLKFDMMKYEPKKITGGENTTAGKLGFNDRNKDRKSIGTVILPIPGGIQDQQQVQWGQDTMDAAAIALADVALSTIVEGFGAGMSSLQNNVNAALGSGEDIKKALATNIAGSAAGAQKLLTRTTGAIMNPNMELLFNSPQLRSFNFSFLLAPRDRIEAMTVIKIIRFFKQGMSPIRSKSRLFLRSPHTFRLAYKHKAAKSEKRNKKTDHPFLNKFKECALNGFGVNYTPSGQYSTYEDGVMTSYQVTMGFQELEPVYNDDYGNSTFPEEIGF